MNDQFEASIEEAYERGVEAGRLDAVPPNTEPMLWCDQHNQRWLSGEDDEAGSLCIEGEFVYSFGRLTCRLEDPVRHWVTVKEGTT